MFCGARSTKWFSLRAHGRRTRAAGRQPARLSREDATVVWTRQPSVVGREDATFVWTQQPAGTGSEDLDSATIIWSLEGVPVGGATQQGCGLEQQPRELGMRGLSRDSRSSDASASTRCSASSSTPSVLPVDADEGPAPPLDLAATSFRPRAFAFAAGGGGWSVGVGDLGFAARRFIAPQLGGGEEAVRGRMSEVRPLVLPEEQLRGMGIPPEASLFAFAYPAVTAPELQVASKDLQEGNIAFLVFGGFMYFDSGMRLQDVRAAVPHEHGPLRLRAPRTLPRGG